MHLDRGAHDLAGRKLHGSRYRRFGDKAVARSCSECHSATDSIDQEQDQNRYEVGPALVEEKARRERLLLAQGGDCPVKRKASASTLFPVFLRHLAMPLKAC